MIQTDRRDPTHVAYADETQYNIGRYRGVGIISLRQRDVDNLTRSLRRLLQDSGMSELKCHRIDNAKHRFAALKVMEHIVKGAVSDLLRVDTLTWDIEDSRHRVRGRDDLANLERMYYHLFKNVLLARWPSNSTWLLCPDEQTAIDWASIGSFLDIAGRKANTRRDLFSQGEFASQLTRKLRIKQIRPCKSHEEPLVQVADLFVGLAAYSRTSFEYFQEWQRAHSQQLRLPETDHRAVPQLSNSDRERCTVLAALDQACKRHRLTVSMTTSSGLKTLDPRKPINFWWYEPQHDEDKAPTRSA